MSDKEVTGSSGSVTAPSAWLRVIGRGLREERKRKKMLRKFRR